MKQPHYTVDLMHMLYNGRVALEGSDTDRNLVHLPLKSSRNQCAKSEIKLLTSAHVRILSLTATEIRNH